MLPFVEPLRLYSNATTRLTLDEPYDNAALPSPRAVLASEVASVVATVLLASDGSTVSTTSYAQVTALPLVYQAVVPAVLADRAYRVRTVVSFTDGRAPMAAERPGAAVPYAGETP